MHDIGHPAYDLIRDVVRMIPHGRVATYGQIARIVGRCTARMVGYAMATLPGGSDVPWHRVVNSRGRISERSLGAGMVRQRRILESEGIALGPGGAVDLSRVGWDGPDGPLPAGIPREAIPASRRAPRRRPPSRA